MAEAIELSGGNPEARPREKLGSLVQSLLHHAKCKLSPSRSLSLSLSLCLFRGSFSLQEIVYYNTSACKCYQIVSRLLILMPLSRKEKRREESPNSFFIFFHFLFYPRGRFRSSLLDILQFSLLSASDILLFSLIFFRFPICTGYSVFSFVCLLVV